MPQHKSIHIPNHRDIPYYVFGDKTKGKRLVITAGVHGCEYIGIMGARELISELEPIEAGLKGQVLIVPITNIEGFYAGAKQIVPTDGINLNRAFPGSSGNTVAYHIASAIEREIYPEADFLVDLHSGDVNEDLVPLVFYPMEGTHAVNAIAKSALDAIDVDYVVESHAKNGLYSWAVQCGIPAIIIERGAQGEWDRATVDKCKQDLYSLMNHLGILKYDGATHKQDHVNISQADYIAAEYEGIWIPAIHAGLHCKSGDILGTLNDTPIIAPFDGVVLYYTKSLGVTKGTDLIAYGKI